jgi:hypothetical protein
VEEKQNAFDAADFRPDSVEDACGGWLKIAAEHRTQMTCKRSDGQTSVGEARYISRRGCTRRADHTIVAAWRASVDRPRRLELPGWFPRRRLAALFRTVNVLLTPVHPFAPLSLSTICSLGEQPDLILKLQRFAAPFDMTGSRSRRVPASLGRRTSPGEYGFVLQIPERRQ